MMAGLNNREVLNCEAHLPGGAGEFKKVLRDGKRVVKGASTIDCTSCASMIYNSSCSHGCYTQLMEANRVLDIKRLLTPRASQPEHTGATLSWVLLEVASKLCS